jgi:RNA polymerase sigma factor (sigma-70 family)
MATMIEATVYIVEDDAPVRDSLLLLLGMKHLRARGFESADRFLTEVRPDWRGCLLLDLRMPGKTGLELQTLLVERGVHLPVIIITAHGDIAAARAAFRAGALDFLEKPLDEDALFSAIAAALERDERRRDADEATTAFHTQMARLSAREREVMWLVADGHQNREIATKLGLSPRTVEIYKARMMEKLQLRRLADLVRAVQGVRRKRSNSE